MPEAHPLDHPILVFDGECGFCRIWIERWRAQTADRIVYRPFQEVADPFHGVSRKQFAKAVGFIGKDGTSSFGAEAVFRLCADGIGKKHLLWMYRRIPGFKQVTEFAYRIIATHRPFAMRVTKLLWGKPAPKSTFHVATNLGLRLIGVVFLIAFWSLRDQIVLLVGQGGLIPFQPALETFHAKAGSLAYVIAPTLTWLNGSDQFLRGLCTAGAIAAVFVMLDILTVPALIVCYACYLSLFTVGQEFMAFQWDLLLLETCFLSILLAITRRWKPTVGGGPASLVTWIFRWLVFRLFFFSGVAKLQSGDPTWHDFTALAYHYLTQPLPTPLAWYAYRLPLWFQKCCTVGTLVIEIVVPFFIFAPRRVRHMAAGVFIAFQAVIAATGNYAFFNLLTVVLCLFLLDDAWYERFTPKRIFSWLTRKRTFRVPWRVTRTFVYIVAACLILVSLMEGLDAFVPSLYTETSYALGLVYPYAVVNEYGLFAVMTIARPEVVIEGSDDGTTWKEYQFAYKPGNDLTKGVSFVAPYQPRIDWQMWFAALATYKDNSWFQPLMTQLLNGKGYARFLFAVNPFPQQPPKYIRAMRYIYRFSPTRDGGAWWTRELQGAYFPPKSLNDLKTP